MYICIGHAEPHRDGACLIWCMHHLSRFEWCACTIQSDRDGACIIWGMHHLSRVVPLSLFMCLSLVFCMPHTVIWGMHHHMVHAIIWGMHHPHHMPHMRGSAWPIQIYMNIYNIYTFIQIYMNIYIFIQIYMNIFIFIQIYMNIYIFIRILCSFLCIHVCIIQ